MRLSSRKPLVCTVAGLLLLAATACGGGSEGSDGPVDQEGTPSQEPEAIPSFPMSARMDLPEGFDNTVGWQTAVNDGPWTVAPQAGLLIQPSTDGDGGSGTVLARDIATGAETWSFAPPTALEGEYGEPVAMDLYVADSPDGEVAVIVRGGMASGDALTKEQPFVTIDTVRTDSTGDAEAVEHLELPGELVVENQDEGGAPYPGALLVSEDYGAPPVLVDPIAGTTEPVALPVEVPLPACEQLEPGQECVARVEASSADAPVSLATARGPVLRYYQDANTCTSSWEPGDDDPSAPCRDGFVVGDAWVSHDAAPDGAAEATPMAVVGDYLVADWTAFPDAASYEEHEAHVIAVHELATGRVVAQTECGAQDGLGSGPEALAYQSTTRLSRNGLYLVSNEAAFDLQGGTAWCLTETDGRNPVTLTDVDDRGLAYGYSGTGVGYGGFPHDYNPDDTLNSGDRQYVPVRVDLADGSATPLPGRQPLLVALAHDTGVFLSNGALTCHPRSS